jgi:hypothetical protein
MSARHSGMYSIIQLEDNAPNLPEQLGTKQKFWLRRKDQRYLFKIGRPGTGENWAEKVASELCELLGLPHALYEFAVWKQMKGVLSPAFVPKDGRLIMGNELLAQIHTDYPTHQVRRVSDHTVGRIHALLCDPKIQLPLGWISPDPIVRTAFDVFIGYLLFDAWIANQDRHHENWGVINAGNSIHLAPSYDHAAALGQNETDANRKDRLETTDRGRHIDSYVQRARSAIYAKKSAPKPLSTIDAFQMAARRRPHAAQFWRNRLVTISRRATETIFKNIPPTEISDTAMEFALGILDVNQNRLLNEEPTQ